MSSRASQVQAEEVGSSPLLDAPKSDHTETTESPILIVTHDGATTVTPDKPKPEPRAKVLFLDGMRGAAAVFVVCHHLDYLHDKNIGGVAVHTFFVLSAFLLTMLLETKFETLYKERASRKRWALALIDYAIRRVLRVYPLVLAVGIMLALSTDVSKHQWYEFRYDLYQFNLLKLLVFAKGHNFYVFWTLPYELTYYLLIPVFVAVTVRLRRWWWVPLVPLTGWVVYAGLTVFVTAGSAPWRHSPEFLSGSIGAVVYNRASKWIKTTGFTMRPWHRIALRALELLVVALLISVIFDALIFKWVARYPFKIKGSDHFVCLHIVILIVCEMLAPGPISSIFEWSVLRYAGKVSFSVYLLHPRIIFSDFMKAQGEYYQKYLCVWLFVGLWSTVSYQVIEYPSQWVAGYVGKKIKAVDTKEREKEMANHYGQLRDD